MKSLRTVAVSLGSALLLACVHVPPTNVSQDRFEYSQSLSDSWKRQTLINVVRLRYADAPVFLDINSVINTYSQSGTVSAGASVPESPDGNLLNLGGTHAWSNSPTVTFQPLQGDKFTKSLLRPIPPASLFQMMQAGWPVELIFPAAVRAINGIRNQSLGTPADPRYAEFLAALGRIQRSDAVGFRVVATKEGEAVVMIISRTDTDALKADSEAVRNLLGLEPDLHEFEIAFGTVPRSRHEVAMLTRSMLEIMLELGAGIEVPPLHIQEQRVLMGGEATDLKPLVRIHSGKQAPGDAYAAVPYKGHWFWIDDRDVPSKRLFTFMMILFSLSETGQPSAAPLVTIGAGK
jgi:hypothetical protein